MLVPGGMAVSYKRGTPVPQRFPLVGEDLTSSPLGLGGTSPTLHLPLKEINAVLTKRLSVHRK